MVDNPTTHDYHEIRENLGLTSGSHSIGIRHHMFTHLYEQLWDEVALVGDKRGPTDLLVTQLLFFRSFIFQWRDEHLHLPATTSAVRLPVRLPAFRCRQRGRGDERPRAHRRSRERVHLGRSNAGSARARAARELPAEPTSLSTRLSSQPQAS